MKLVLMILLFLGLAIPQAAAQDQAKQILNSLSLIEARVKKVEMDQKEILDRQEKILTEIDRLRVWVHRS